MIHDTTLVLHSARRSTCFMRSMRISVENATNSTGGCHELRESSIINKHGTLVLVWWYGFCCMPPTRVNVGGTFILIFSYHNHSIIVDPPHETDIYLYVKSCMCSDVNELNVCFIYTIMRHHRSSQKQRAQSLHCGGGRRTDLPGRGMSKKQKLNTHSPYSLYRPTGFMIDESWTRLNLNW